MLMATLAVNFFLCVFVFLSQMSQKKPRLVKLVGVFVCYTCYRKGGELKIQNLVLPCGVFSPIHLAFMTEHMC